MRVIKVDDRERQRIHDADVIVGVGDHAHKQRVTDRLREAALHREVLRLRLQVVDQTQDKPAPKPAFDWSSFFACTVQAWPAAVMFGGLSYLLFLVARVFAGMWLSWLVGLFAFGAGCQALTAFGLPFVALRRSP